MLGLTQFMAGQASFYQTLLIMRRFHPIIIFVISLSACTGGPLRLHIPQARFELPESTGKNHVNIEAWRSFDEYTITFTENTALDPVDTQNPQIVQNDPHSSRGSDDDGNVAARVGITDFLEVYYKTEGDFLVGLKYQFAGEPSSKSNAGDFSSALALGYGGLEEDSDEFADAKLTADFWDVSLIGGYRVNKPVLLYSALFHSQYDYTIKIDPYAVNQFQQRFNGEVDVSGINLGMHVKFGKRFSIAFEAIRSDIESGHVSTTEDFYGFIVGLRF